MPASAADYNAGLWSPGAILRPIVLGRYALPPGARGVVRCAQSGRSGVEDGKEMKTAITLLLGLFAAAQTPAAPPAPATYLSEAELTTALKAAAPAAPDMHTAPVKNADHYRINVVQRTKAQGAIAHP